MNKDVIYIDTEDDITAIIGKIKSSHEKIVALVPPKRIGVLQSAVNLRLLARMAQTSNKHLVIITNNRALTALSAVAMIPIAKNLQSKPEIAEAEELDMDENEDVIDGAQLPIDELARTVDKQSDDVDDAVETIDIENDSPTSSKTFSKNTIKVPNFSNFRKKFFIGGAVAVLLAIFLVWAIIFAPAAKIVITAKTESAPVSLALKLGGTDPTDISKGTVQTITKQIQQDQSVDFTATGTKDLGNKATGTMQITRTSISNIPLSVPAGTSFTSGNYVFLSTKAATLAATQVGANGNIQDSTTIDVIASAPGEGYNLPAQSYKPSVSGFSAKGSVMAGGTTKLSSMVVTADDIQKASQALSNLPTDTVKQQLIAQFTNGEFVIDASFSASRATAVPVPTIDTEATDGKAKLTSKVTYTITAIAKSEVQAYLDNALGKQVTDTNKQRIYDDGIDHVTMSGYFKTDQIATVSIATVGQVGPSIDQDFVKQQSKGKRYGEIQSILSSIQGVTNVDVRFPYFWINTVPDDINKIQVEFQIQNG